MHAGDLWAMRMYSGREIVCAHVCDSAGVIAYFAMVARESEVGRKKMEEYKRSLEQAERERSSKQPVESSAQAAKGDATSIPKSGVATTSTSTSTESK
eukprot:1358322-Amorphochlora_amoeboformis.AAC.1